MTWKEWNEAIGDYLMKEALSDGLYGLYMDWDKLERIGQAAHLGGKAEFLSALRERGWPGRPHPLTLAAVDLKTANLQWFGRGDASLDRGYPPVLVAYVLLIIAWTESTQTDESSYYGRLHTFLDATFPDVASMNDSKKLHIVRELALSMDRFAKWLERLHPEMGNWVIKGALNDHRYVGRIRMHALADPTERRLLPALWTEFSPGGVLPWDEKVMLRRLRESSNFRKYFPKLHRSLHATEEGRRATLEFLHQTYQAWKGQHHSFPANPQRHTPQPYDYSKMFAEPVERPSIRPELSLLAGKALGPGLYASELPPWVRASQKPSLFMTSGSDPLHLEPVSEGLYRLTPLNLLPRGSYTLRLPASDPGKGISFDLAPALEIHQPHQCPPRTWGPDGHLHEGAAHGYMHGRFWGDTPDAPSLIGAWMLAPKSSSVPEPPALTLTHKLVAKAQGARYLTLTRFKDTLNAHTAQVQPLSAKERGLLIHQMASLGYFSHDQEQDCLCLDPPQITLLPDNHLRIRALLTGMVPARMHLWIARWSLQEGTGIVFAWQAQADAPLVPPILSLETHSILHLREFEAALQAEFPDGLVPMRPFSRAEALLGWLAPWQKHPQPPASRICIAACLSLNAKAWNLSRARFCDTEPGQFPALTRDGKQFHWWHAADEGWPVPFPDALPSFLAETQVPFWACDCQRTDRILFLCPNFLPPPLEEALVLATGLLPCSIQAKDIYGLPGIFSPDARFRMFSGIRPGMRQNLRRILRAFPEPIPVSIHPQNAF